MARGYYNKVLRMAGPMAFSRFINMAAGILGLMFASHLGKDVLAATALINASGALVFLIGMSILFAIGVVVAQLYGAGKQDQIGALFQQSLLLGTLIVIPSIVVYWYMGDILLMFGENKNLIGFLVQYFHTLVWGAPFLFLLVIVQQLLYALKKQQVVMISNIICFIPFAAFSYAIILGHFGLPRLGIKGLAISFVFLNILNSMFLLGYAILQKDFRQYNLFTAHSHKGLVHIKKLFKVGWPMAVQFGGEFLCFFLIIVMVGWIGEMQLGAFQVVVQWQQLIIVPIFGVSEATGILVGHAAGAKKYSELKPIFWATINIICMVSVIIAILYISFHKFLSGFYIDIHDPKNKAMLHLIAMLFALAAVSRFFDNLKIVISGALRGLHDTRFAMWVSVILSFLVSLPVGYLLAIKLHVGPSGFLISNILTIGATSVLLYYRWRQQQNKVLQVVN